MEWEWIGDLDDEGYMGTSEKVVKRTEAEARIKELEQNAKDAVAACELCRNGDEASHVRYVLGGRA